MPNVLQQLKEPEGLGYGVTGTGTTGIPAGRVGSGTKLDLRVRIGSGNTLLVTGRVGYQKAFTRRPLNTNSKPMSGYRLVF